MRAFIRRHLSYANVMATIAVFVALGGSTFAASYVITKSSQIKDGTVTSSDVKNSSLTGSDVKDSGLTNSDIKNSSLTGSDIKDKSLTPSDFNGSVQGPTGPQGPAGLPGATGAQGPPGKDFSYIAVRTSGSQSGTANAFCNSGEVPQGGGGFSSDGFLTGSNPITTGWRAQAKFADGSPAQIEAYVVCAS